MFANYPMHPGGGVNPPYSPAYPLEWDARIRTVDVITEVDSGKLTEILSTTPFEKVNNRVSFRFMMSTRHTLAVWTEGLFDLMITVPVRYKGLFTHTHIYMYCSDSMGIAAGRELLGYTKKDCSYQYRETSQGEVSGWVKRRGVPLADFDFTPDANAPMVNIVEGEEQPRGELHVRRVPHPAKPEPVYSDVVYRDMPLEYVEFTPGQVEMTLHPSGQDPIADLEPKILGAHHKYTDVFGGGLGVEDRRLVERVL